MNRGRRRKPKKYSRFSRFARGVGTVTKLARDVQFLRSVVNVEKKYLDTIVAITPSTTTNISVMNAMAQGTSAITRQGQSVKNMSMWIQFNAMINAAATQTFLRMVVVCDSQCNAAAPTAASLFVTPGDVLTPLVIGSAKRYRILADKRIALNINGHQNQIGKIFRKLYFHTEYNTGNAGTVSDIVTNSISVLSWSSEALNTPNLNYTFRLRFVDN